LEESNDDEKAVDEEADGKETDSSINVSSD